MRIIPILWSVLAISILSVIIFFTRKWFSRHEDTLAIWASVIQVVSLPLIIGGLVLTTIQLSDYTTKPDLHLVFVDPEDMSFTVVNSENAVAELPIYWIVLIDLNLLPSLEPLPIKTKEWSHVRPLATQTAIDLSSLSLIKMEKGHRYFGYAGIVCKNCNRVRMYWLYFVHGTKDDDWVSEFSEKQLSEPFDPTILLDKDYEARIRELVPIESRIPIPIWGIKSFKARPGEP